MGKCHLAGTGNRTSADKPGHGNRMMGTAERTLTDDILRLEQSGHRINLCHLKSLLPRHRRKNRRDAACQHRLP